MKEIKILSPAKINLNLKVGKLQKNNLHKIETIMQTISLYDEITIKNLGLIKGQQKISIKIAGKQKKGVPSNAENTVYKAAKLFFKENKIKDSVKITINKNIPSKAGLGGASSNSAYTLKALEKLFNYKLKNPTKTASQIGSDVAFFLLGAPSAIAKGTGEKIKKIKPINFHCIIAMLPNIFISTEWAYKNLPKTKKYENDFENLAYKYFPDLLDLKNKFIKNKAKKANLTGSGSAIFALFKNKKTAENCVQNLKNQCSFIDLNKTLLED